jgi:hypothetical protein
MGILPDAAVAMPPFPGTNLRDSITPQQRSLSGERIRPFPAPNATRVRIGHPACGGLIILKRLNSVSPATTIFTAANFPLPPIPRIALDAIRSRSGNHLGSIMQLNPVTGLQALIETYFAACATQVQRKKRARRSPFTKELRVNAPRAISPIQRGIGHDKTDAISSSSSFAFAFSVGRAVERCFFSNGIAAI